ncbi:MAG TPA: permease-like cell division protein FtsX [Patescibacteria group bacterium]
MRLVDTTFKSLRRSPYQALSAIIVTTLTFFLATLFLMMAISSQIVLSYFQSRPQISAFLQEGVTEEEIGQIKADLEATGEVSEIKYVSKEEALAIYRDQNKDDPLLLELVTADILPASLEVSANDPAMLSSLSDKLRENEHVDEVVFQKDVVDSLTRWINLIRIAGVIIIGFLTLVSLAVILMIIGMRIAVRREEIAILKLVGASMGYIRKPFLFEGIIYGVTGAFTGLLMVLVMMLYAYPFLKTFFSGLPFFPLSWPILAIVSFSVLIFGLILGAAASLVALARYLR